MLFDFCRQMKELYVPSIIIRHFQIFPLCRFVRSAVYHLNNYQAGVELLRMCSRTHGGGDGLVIDRKNKSEVSGETPCRWLMCCLSLVYDYI